MSSLREVFLEEAGDLLAEIEPMVLEMEKEASAEIIDGLFRTVHTLKGSSGVAGVKGIGTLAHRLEELLEGLRSGEIGLQPTLVDLLLTGFDQLKMMVADLARGEDSDPSGDLLERIATYGRGKMQLCPCRSDGPDFGERGSRADKDGSLYSPAGVVPEETRSFLKGELQRGNNIYQVVLDLGRDFFRQGHNLGYLLEDLAELGTVAGLTVDHERIPALSALNAEDCYLTLTIWLSTGEALESVEETFLFVRSDENKVIVRLLNEEELDRGGTMPPTRADIPPMVDVLRQQEKALLLADEDVLPGFLPVVRRILARIGERVGPVARDRVVGEAGEGREELLGKVRTLLDLLGQGARPETATTISREAGHSDGDGRRKEKNIGQKGNQNAFRVRRETAEALMGLAGEMVIAKNSLPYLVKKLETAGMAEHARELKERYHYLDRIAREIHDRVMDIWLLPVQEVFGRFPRYVRDQAKALDKKVDLVTAGGDTRIDRDIIEDIYEPLLHLVRNCLDHGLEEPEERLSLGKNATGVIRLSAFRRGDRIVLQVSDDGRGIDVEALVTKAISNGKLTTEQAEAMGRQEKMKLVFLPGLSSKEGISELSGRGVGMDAVETTVSRLGGTIQLESAPGQGTMFTIDLPFTLATNEVLLVRIQDAVYGLPLAAVGETVRVGKGNLRTVRGRPVALLRGDIIPLVDSRLCLEAIASRKNETILVVLRHKVALPVDAVLGKEVVILKPLAGELKKLSVFTGAAVLGDGRVLLVIDPNEMVRLSLQGWE